MSPATSQQGQLDPVVAPPRGSSALPTAVSSPKLGRIPRKSSLASIKNAMSRSESRPLSPGPSSAGSAASQIQPFPAQALGLPSPATAFAGQGDGSGAKGSLISSFPSPPTHASLPSANQSVQLPSFMPAYPPSAPETDLVSPPPLFRNDSDSPAGNASPRFQQQVKQQQQQSGYMRSASGSVLPPLDSTPEMPSGGPRFLGHTTPGGTVGGQQISSAPVTPAYAEPSLVNSSGRFGKPVKANTAKSKFRMSESSYAVQAKSGARTCADWVCNFDRRRCRPDADAVAHACHRPS